MKQKLSTTLALVILMVAIAAATARAQTVANGPYYAPPSWDQTLPSSTRFIVLSNMNSQAVLDRETGLVWERSPDLGAFAWNSQRQFCIRQKTGGRFGWRLPSISELTSLLDPSSDFFSSLPALPAGHPFQNIAVNFIGGDFWSATTDAGNSLDAWWVATSNGGSVDRATKTNSPIRAWCVRGGGVLDNY